MREQTRITLKQPEHVMCHYYKDIVLELKFGKFPYLHAKRNVKHSTR
jgi:hypothetical protein